MVKSIINGRVPRHAGVVGGIDNGRQKTRNHGYDVIVGGELFTDYLITSQTWLLTKTQINRRRTLPAFPPGCHRKKRLAWKTSLSESQDAVALQQIKERGALPKIDRGDYPPGNRPLQQYLGFTAGRWLWSVRA